MESNILKPLNEESVGDFVKSYEMNPEILLRLLHPLCQSLRDPLLEGFYDRTNDFGDVSNSKRRKKKKQKDTAPKMKSSTKNTRKANSDRLNRLTPNKKESKLSSAPDELSKTTSAPPPDVSVPKSPNKKKKKKTKVSVLSKTPDHDKKRKSKSKSSKSTKSSKSKKLRSRTVSPNRGKKGRRSAPTSEDEDESIVSDQSEISTDDHHLSTPNHSEIDDIEEEEESDEKASIPLTYDDYIANYHDKFVSNTADGLTYPNAWTCLYYHQMGGDLEFEVEDLESAWNEGTLVINHEEQDEDGRDGDDENGLDAVPDTVFDFKKDANICYDLYDNRKIYVYRIRRWTSEEIPNDDNGTGTEKEPLPTYSWIADKISYLDDYPLTDDLICIQDTDCLSQPTWCKWIDSTENGMYFIRDSGFFNHRTNHKGIYGVTDCSDILNSGVCMVGDFKFGFQPDLENDMDLYGIIRLDILTPSLVQFPWFDGIGNLGKSRCNDGVIDIEKDCKLALVQNGGLHFDNKEWYQNGTGGVSKKGKSPTSTMRLDLKPLVNNYVSSMNKKDLPDIWTLFLSFSHPMANRKGEKSTLLFKKHCMDLTIENRYEGDDNDDDNYQKLIAEELVLKIYSKNSGSRFIEIFRERIPSRKKKWVNSLVVSFGKGGRLFCALNGKRVETKKKKLNRTNLFKVRPSSVLLLGHKCTSGDTGSVYHVFNGSLLEFAIYPKQFAEFEVRAFHQQSLQHAAKYRQLFSQ